MAGSSVQFMITNAMRATLIDELEFKPEEVDVMRPEVAAELIEKKMKRPFGNREMPDEWKKDWKGLADGDGGGRGGFSLGPIGDLFRSLFYMTATAGIMLGVACAINEEARLGVKDLWKDVKRMLKGKKRRKRRRRLPSRPRRCERNGTRRRSSGGLPPRVCARPCGRARPCSRPSGRFGAPARRGTDRL